MLSSVVSDWRIKYNQPNLQLIGIIKEVEGDDDATNKLGIEEFQRDYFSNGTIYIDEKRDFYKALGYRPVNKWSLLNPYLIYQFVTRASAKNIQGNLAGEGLVQGGIIVIGHKEQGVVYEHLETIGEKPEAFIGSIEEAVSLISSSSSSLKGEECSSSKM